MNCCKTSLTDFELILQEYQLQTATAYKNIFTRIYRGEIFGQGFQYFDTIQDLNYLGILLTLMYWDIQNDHINNEEADWKDRDYWYEKYKLTCIAKKFSCMSLNIVPMINLFLPVPQQGIDFMEIEGVGPDPIFIVT